MPDDKRKCTDQFEPSTPPETHPGILTFGFEVFKLTPQAKMPLKCLVIGPLSTLKKKPWSNSCLDSNMKIK